MDIFHRRGLLVRWLYGGHCCCAAAVTIRCSPTLRPSAGSRGSRWLATREQADFESCVMCRPQAVGADLAQRLVVRMSVDSNGRKKWPQERSAVCEINC